MKLFVCAVYDKGISAFNTPMFFRALGEAKRSFLDACAPTGQKAFLLHPQDYVLMHLGMYDDQNGEMIGEANGPQPVMSALEAVSIMNQGQGDARPTQ